ncbi:tetratricopeptide repeat protein [Paenibacillus sp. MMS18-CY102]|uniref:tetratricopeptide repeat protein n=1 Tax=Paenibacillus sp. MMS18-CY102 TaxID=2682849 RepID=UPI001365C2AA|nr:tetratricopeptide repeat protein [Paenibacillus sp. MMS18-CY102]MWC30858.1 tetratricopeptide repeat protein [Paenibacillus sp. MMS18-CY102]
MKEKQRAVSGKPAKIIPVQWDATYFFERAVRSLDRYHYDKALKNFKRAAHFEPENPVNHCNMAGILSELGNYEESNKILKWIVDELDPTMTECHFYMANNYANMEMYEAAEDSLVQYLEEDDEGHFIDEAEEMMELLTFELARPTKQANIKSLGGMREHDQARVLLEEGKFAQAVKLLEDIVEQHPEFSAARNNLALAFYYMGQFDKAMQTILKVLELDEGNLHALCNLAIFYQHGGEREKLANMLGLLRKTYPFHQEHAFKLATTLGILGDHEGAYRHFSRLIRTSGNVDGSLCHYAAVAACQTGRYAEAEKLWQQGKAVDPQSEVAPYYLDYLAEVKAKGQQPAPVSYHYHLPFEEQIKLWERLPGEAIPERFKRDPLVRSSFFWALRHGDRQTKLQVIQALGMIGDDEVREALHAFLKEPQEEDDLKRIALLVLRSIGDTESVEAVFGGEPTIVEPRRIPTRLPVWEDSWQDVLEEALRRMRPSYDLVQQHDLLTLWIEFLSRIYPDVPKIGKPGGWAAALEYWTAKMHSRPVSFEEVARRYETSAATVSKHARRIDEVCGIQDKMRSANAVLQTRPIDGQE